MASMRIHNGVGLKNIYDCDHGECFFWGYYEPPMPDEASYGFSTRPPLVVEAELSNATWGGDVG